MRTKEEELKNRKTQIIQEKYKRLVIQDKQEQMKIRNSIMAQNLLRTLNKTPDKGRQTKSLLSRSLYVGTPNTERS